VPPTGTKRKALGSSAASSPVAPKGARTTEEGKEYAHEERADVDMGQDEVDTSGMDLETALKFYYGVLLVDDRAAGVLGRQPD